MLIASFLQHTDWVLTTTGGSTGWRIEAKFRTCDSGQIGHMFYRKVTANARHRGQRTKRTIMNEILGLPFVSVVLTSIKTNNAHPFGME